MEDIKMVIALIMTLLAAYFFSMSILRERRTQSMIRQYTIYNWVAVILSIVGLVFEVLAMKSANNIQLSPLIMGFVALFLIIYLASFATNVLFKKDQVAFQLYHKIGLLFWIIWLILALGGMFIQMM